MNEKPEQFDYIVIGAGAAGCVVASRLSEERSCKVLLLEEGPHDRSLFIRATGGFFKTHATKRTFLFLTESEELAKGRRFPLMQGRTLGGGTSVNAMVYIRGQPQDYNEWAALGCKGWSYSDVLPYFRKAENNDHLAGQFHGADGPLRVSDGAHRHVLSEAFVRAAQETSLPGRNSSIRFNHDFNGESQDGVGFYQTMSHRGERSSTSRSFLAVANQRPNLSVRVDALVERVLFEGCQVVGVRYREASGKIQDVHATREVILSAGAFMSPKLLMLSGVGPADDLKKHGIPVVCNSPNVGKNYQDHFQVPMDAGLLYPIGFIGQDRGLNAVRNALQWLFFRKGPLASNVVEAGGFFDLDDDGRSDIQLNAVAVSSTGWGDPMPKEHRFSLAPMCLTCHSRGVVSLRSADPSQPPIVRGNFFHQKDIENLTNGVILSRRISSMPSLRRYLTDETLPGPSVGDERSEIADYVRSTTKTALHPTSTCAMGPDMESVVDLELRVRGVNGLRVVDGSVMPRLIRGNTAAPIIMIAEKASDLIKMSGAHKG